MEIINLFVEYLKNKNLSQASIVRYIDQAPKFIKKLSGVNLFSILSVDELHILRLSLEQLPAKIKTFFIGFYFP